MLQLRLQQVPRLPRVRGARPGLQRAPEEEFGVEERPASAACQQQQQQQQKQQQQHHDEAPLAVSRPRAAAPSHGQAGSRPKHSSPQPVASYLGDDVRPRPMPQLSGDDPESPPTAPPTPTSGPEARSSLTFCSVHRRQAWRRAAGGGLANEASPVLEPSEDVPTVPRPKGLGRVSGLGCAHTDPHDFAASSLPFAPRLDAGRGRADRC
mmetsp:Transcript_61086/g.129049  ORF Transcript_61086/g.129049 Transcript_61086/m.129049 type:complete len:209 (+) Transcript_61086:296-922(+)